ncbi:MAG: proton-conducting transporter membrane subunit [Syntrophales bacterium]|nr:proton-conducting transporter membrane subunit [Syntrophales bacterium]
MALFVLIITPFVAALASLAVQRKVRPLEIIAAVAALIEFGSVINIAETLFYNGHCKFGAYFSIDALGMIVLITVTLVGFAASYYSIGYLRQEVAKKIIGFHRVKQYFVLFHLFQLAMFFAIITVNPIMMWIAIEATTLSTAFLISFYNKPSAMEAAWKYLIINSVGLLLGFFGTLLFFTSATLPAADTFVTWQTLLSNAANLNPLLVKIAFIFVLIGYGTKAGLAPMHTWLPDAHSKAPSPISALLSGALLNCALLAILKFKVITDAALGVAFSQKLLIFFGVISIAIPAFIIIVQKNYKRLFAYSSIEHIGIATLGFGFGGLGSFAALLHIIYHSLVKSILFFSAGNILLKYGSTKIDNVGGVLRALPVTGKVLFLGFLAVTGVPPFGIFLTEVYILTAGIADHPGIVIAALIFLALIFVGFLRFIAAMVFGKIVPPVVAGEVNYSTIVPPVALLAVLITLGFYLPSPLVAWISTAAALIH